MGMVMEEDWEELMQETPEGSNHGWKAPELVGVDEMDRDHHGERRPRKSLARQDHESEGEVHDIHPQELYLFGS